MLPLAETEKLIREKDEEVSKHLASPPPKASDPLQGPSLASPGFTANNLAPHSCAACKRCWRRCRPRCSRIRLRASSRMLSEARTRACLNSAPPSVRCWSNPGALDFPASNPGASAGGSRPPLALALCRLLRLNVQPVSEFVAPPPVRPWLTSQEGPPAQPLPASLHLFKLSSIKR